MVVVKAGGSSVNVPQPAGEDFVASPSFSVASAVAVAVAVALPLRCWI